MPTVALVGPDGAGKTSVARALEGRPDLAVRYLYMGVSAASSDRLLPTTRLAHALKRALGAPPDTAGPPPLPASGDLSASGDRPTGGHGHAARTRSSLPASLGAIRGGLRLANRLAEEWYRQFLAWRYARQGQTVVFDRHFYLDYHAYDVIARPGRSLGRRVHGWALEHLYPRPDLVLYLDAPAALLLARKGEGTLEALERRRHDYLALEEVVPAFASIDASRPLDDVVADVAARIRALSVADEVSDRATSPATRPGAGPAARRTRGGGTGKAASRGKPGTTPRRVLVTDAERGSAVAIIRSLERSGWEVTAASADHRAAGLRSRATRHRLVYPAPARDAVGAAEAILRAAEERHLDLVIPVTDDVILPLRAIRHRFPPHTRMAIAADAALDLVGDKAATLQLAESLGLPTPRGRLATDLPSASAAADELGWPVVLKPAVSRQLNGQTIRRLSVTFADDQAELTERAAPLLATAPLLVQEYVAGRGVGVELLLDGGRPLAAFQHRRLRDVPVTGGASAFRESVALDPTLLDQATRLMASLAWTGLAMVEFRVPPHGPARLMEVNGRVWGSLPLAIAAGVDFPARLADLLCPGPEAQASELDTEPESGGTPGSTVPRAAYRLGLRAHSLPLETTWIATVLLGRRRFRYLPFPPRRAVVGAVLSLFDPRTSHDVLSLRDPLPGAAEIVGLAAKAVRRMSGDAG